jgi:phosphoglycolate phosphatase
MSYQYVLFDLDGTVTDPKTGITKSVAYALEYFCIHVENLDTLCKFIGPPLSESFQEFYGFDKDKAKMAINKYREYFSDKGIYENEVYPGMDKLLQNLKDYGKTVLLATSKTTFFAEKIINYFKLDQYFDFISGNGMEINLTKEDVIRCALDKYGVTDYSKAIMVGDRKHDIFGAKYNGIASAGVLFGYGGREELEAAGADYVVESVAELDTLLNQ